MRIRNWFVFFSFTSGFIWIGRALIEVIFKPDYWNPQSFIDYLAVLGTSIGLLSLAAMLWLIHTRNRPQGSIRKWFWRIGMLLSIGGGLVAGLANFGEDWIGIKDLGTFFIFGFMGLFAGLLISGISTIGNAALPKLFGWLLVACAISIGFSDQGGGIIVGFCLLVLGMSKNLNIVGIG